MNIALQCLREELRTMYTHYYPMFVSLRKKMCLVVGGGSVGERKLRGLLQYGAGIRLLAEDLTPWLRVQCAEGTVQLVGKTYTKAHLDGVDLVFAATNDPRLNSQVAGDAAECGLWCNTATEPEEGSFIVPSIVRKGPLTIAISTGGASPAVAVQIKQKLAHEFGAEWIVLLNLMALLRTTIQSKGLHSTHNQDIYRRIAQIPLLEWIQNGEETETLQAILEICHPWVNFMELKQIWDEAWKQSS
jgi:precorrin-2 dehydrogenase / sirohydrochlorin ferrochelatase